MTIILPVLNPRGGQKPRTQNHCLSDNARTRKEGLNAIAERQWKRLLPNQPPGQGKVNDLHPFLSQNA